MAQITQEQVIEVATAKIGRGEDRIERVYRWQFEQALAAVRATFVLAGSIIGATLTALIQRAGPVAPWQTLIVAAALPARSAQPFTRTRGSASCTATTSKASASSRWYNACWRLRNGPIHAFPDPLLDRAARIGAADVRGCVPVPH